MGHSVHSKPTISLNLSVDAYKKIRSPTGHDVRRPGRLSNEVLLLVSLSLEELYHAFSGLANSHPFHWKDKHIFKIIDDYILSV